MCTRKVIREAVTPRLSNARDDTRRPRGKRAPSPPSLPFLDGERPLGSSQPIDSETIYSAYNCTLMASDACIKMVHIKPSISRLNKDCLAEIFYNCAFEIDYGYGRNSPWDHLSRGKMVVHLSHVCKSWRLLALSMSELWASIVTAFPDGFPERLERARGIPLTFGPHHEWDHDGWSAQTSYLTAHVERFRTIMCPEDLRLSWIEHLPGKVFPHLRQASFANREPGYFSDISFQADHLQSLRLYHFAVHFTAPNLTSLTIYMPFEWQVEQAVSFGQDVPVEAFIPATQLIRMLRSTPLLTHLKIHHCIFSDDWDPTEWDSENGRQSIVTLNHLEYLSIRKEYCSHIAVFLLALSIPTRTSIRFSTFFPRSTDDELQHLCRELAPYMRSSSCNSVRVTSRCDYSDESAFFELFHKDRRGASISIFIEDSERRLEDGSMSSVAIYEAIFAELPSSTIHELYVDPPTVDQSFTAADTPAVFHGSALSASVETLYYSLEPPFGLSTGELGPAHFGRGLLPDFLLDWPATYPALKHVRISSYVTLYKKAVVADAIQKVKQWLEARVKLGLPVQTLTLCGTIEGTDGKANDLDLYGPLLDLVDVQDTRRVFSSKSSNV
ncbi:unnamed protein product [Peniophora sp. CBMAI 1063]|nr:unnamed protein product [Peniophora sp. CBMAI 1063]